MLWSSEIISRRILFAPSLKLLAVNDVMFNNREGFPEVVTMTGSDAAMISDLLRFRSRRNAWPGALPELWHSHRWKRGSPAPFESA